MFVLSVCVGRGSLTPEARPGGGRSLLRPQPMKPEVAFQALEFRCCWAWWRVGTSLGGQIRGDGSLPRIPKPPQPPDREKRKSHLFSG